jgi:hypothetical protein
MLSALDVAPSLGSVRASRLCRPPALPPTEAARPPCAAAHAPLLPHTLTSPPDCLAALAPAGEPSRRLEALQETL